MRLNRVAQDRQIQYERREYAMKTYVMSSNERNNMKLHFERSQADKDYENRIKDQIRENRRNNTIQLGQKIQSLPIQPGLDEQYMDDELLEGQANL